jgi:hypothetical protein
MLFAVIENNKVANIIVADSKEIAEVSTNKECIEYAEDSSVKIGYLWDGENFVSPITEEPVIE